MTDVVALLGRGALLKAPFKDSISRACRPPCAPERRSSLRTLQETCGDDVVLEGAGFVLGDPDANKVAGKIVALRQRMGSRPQCILG